MLGIPLSIAVVLSGSPETAKCPPSHTLPGATPGEPAVLVDGEIVSGLEAIDRATLHSLEITCWNPESDEVHAERGVQLVHVVTKARVLDVQQALESFRSAFAAFRAEAGVSPESLEELSPFGLTSPQRFPFDAGSSPGGRVEACSADL